MHVIITATAPTIDAPMDARFGRAAYFLRVNTETLDAEALSNPASTASGGAGTQAAQFVARQHVGAIISGDFGPKALSVLNATGMALYLSDSSLTVRDVIHRFKNGLLEQVTHNVER